MSEPTGRPPMEYDEGKEARWRRADQEEAEREAAPHHEARMARMKQQLEAALSGGLPAGDRATDSTPTEDFTMTTTLDLSTFRLSSGAHGRTFCGEACLVELSNLIAAKKVRVPTELAPPTCKLVATPFKDDHPSISRVVRAFAIGLNDAWNDEDRQKLLPYAPQLLCTATGDADEETRAWMATDWLARVHAPAFLRLAGLDEHARVLESLARIVDPITAESARPALDRAREASAAAWAAAWDAAWDAARAAARDAAWAAASAAAWDAAWAAAWAAARAAARAAADGKLRPVVVELQGKALVLLDEMIAVGKREPSHV
ncbi:MAG TPA: hypothetical protein VHM30_08705 [Gemmatimonadaceae bacterium]|nr:hypothetical protein [Gemmatimonadaceae bacterium]